MQSTFHQSIHFFSLIPFCDKNRFDKHIFNKLGFNVSNIILTILVISYSAYLVVDIFGIKNNTMIIKKSKSSRNTGIYSAM